MRRREFLGAAVSAGVAGVSVPRILRAATPCPPPTFSVTGGQYSSATCVAQPPGVAPTWFLNLQAGTWGTIAGGTGQRITDVLPSPLPSNPPGEVSGDPASIASAWTGGAVDQSRAEYILCANGGHADYAGNEAYGISLRDETPKWRRLSDPTPNSQMNFSGTTGSQGAVNNDGRPRSMHSTFEVYGDGRVWFPLQNAYASGAGGLSKAVWSYNRDALGAAASPLQWSGNDLGPWQFHGMVPTAYDGSVLKFGVAAFDRVAHKIWALAGESANYSLYWSIDTQGPTLGTIRMYAANQSFGSWNSWVAIAHDLRILVAADYGRGVVTVLDLNSPTSFTQVANITGTGYHERGSGGVYIAANNTIACGNPKNTGRSISVLQIPTKLSGGTKVYDPAGTWTWRTIAPSGPTIGVAVGNSDIYSKWNIIEDMGNGQSAIVVATDIAGPVYIFKVPTTGI